MSWNPFWIRVYVTLTQFLAKPCSSIQSSEHWQLVGFAAAWDVCPRLELVSLLFQLGSALHCSHLPVAVSPGKEGEQAQLYPGVQSFPSGTVWGAKGGGRRGSQRNVVDCWSDLVVDASRSSMRIGPGWSGIESTAHSNMVLSESISCELEGSHLSQGLLQT